MKKQIINVSDYDPNWNWLADDFKTTDLEWKHCSSLTARIPKFLPKRQSLGRFYSAINANLSANKNDTILVSHAPRPIMYTSKIAKVLRPNITHLGASFTFTELPVGLQHKTMSLAFKQPSKFLCYSNIERKIYAEYFDIPIEKIDMIHWSVHHPEINEDEAPYETGDYICALGTEGRDYKTLFAAMAQLPNIKLVVVATWKNLAGLLIPENVKVVNNIPLSTAMNILMHSKFMVLPLKDKTTTCGHSTLVASMFYRKSVLITNAPAIHDYIEDGKTGIYFEPQDVNDLKRKIELLWDDPSNTVIMNNAAYAFAVEHCTEKTVINYFANFINSVNQV